MNETCQVMYMVQIFYITHKSCFIIEVCSNMPFVKKDRACHEDDQDFPEPVSKKKIKSFNELRNENKQKVEPEPSMTRDSTVDGKG